ncbi:MAG TPA: hypothetical protein VEK38_02350 [Candidatus Bathyarchaeia archaeon]|nr:hypothetical protein [Candidatus Bathyarchaeia archaeon]
MKKQLLSLIFLCTNFVVGMEKDGEKSAPIVYSWQDLYQNYAKEEAKILPLTTLCMKVLEKNITEEVYKKFPLVVKEQFIKYLHEKNPEHPLVKSNIASICSHFYGWDVYKKIKYENIAPGKKIINYLSFSSDAKRLAFIVGERVPGKKHHGLPTMEEKQRECGIVDIETEKIERMSLKEGQIRAISWASDDPHTFVTGVKEELDSCESFLTTYYIGGDKGVNKKRYYINGIYDQEMLLMRKIEFFVKKRKLIWMHAHNALHVYDDYKEFLYKLDHGKYIAYDVGDINTWVTLEGGKHIVTMMKESAQWHNKPNMYLWNVAAESLVSVIRMNPDFPSLIYTVEESKKFPGCFYLAYGMYAKKIPKETIEAYYNQYRNNWKTNETKLMCSILNVTDPKKPTVTSHKEYPALFKNMTSWGRRPCDAAVTDEGGIIFSKPVEKEERCVGSEWHYWDTECNTVFPMAKNPLQYEKNFIQHRGIGNMHDHVFIRPVHSQAMLDVEWPDIRILKKTESKKEKKEKE